LQYIGIKKLKGKNPSRHKKYLAKISKAIKLLKIKEILR